MIGYSIEEIIKELDKLVFDSLDMQTKVLYIELVKRLQEIANELIDNELNEQTN